MPGDDSGLGPTDRLGIDAVRACSELIRFDTSNFGGGDARGERAAAEWVAAELAAAGYSPGIVEPAPGRTSTVVRIAGSDPHLPAVLVHGHLDVVPAVAEDWSFDPFGGEIRDGAVWGRGALDMKGAVATMLAVAVGLARDGVAPARDVVLAFVADEEDTGRLGSGYLVTERPELFDGVTTAIGESGAVLQRLPGGGHLYAVATAERGTARLTITARGPAGHGSRPLVDNAITVLAGTVTRLAAIEWPVTVIPAVASLLDGLAAHLGVRVDPADPESVLALGEAAHLVSRTLTNTLSPTMLSAGYKANVIPSEAHAVIDGRVLPECEEQFFDAVDAVLGPNVSRRVDEWAAPVSAPGTNAELAAFAAALREHDPEALVLPYCMAGGTDAKWWSQLGIACYGFTPGRTDPGFEGGRGVHGVDEHVPIDSLAFGAAVLDTYLRSPPPGAFGR